MKGHALMRASFMCDVPIASLFLFSAEFDQYYLFQE